MNNAFETLSRLGPLRIAILGLVLFTLIGFFVFVSLKVSTPSMKLLYADLSSTDSAAAAAKLEEIGIPYQVSADGARIMVSENEVGRARMLLAQEGLPNGGSMGYEIFDKQSGFGTTNFVQNINQVRALEGELARTISSLGPISSARVHLVLPQRELFARENRPASASVFLKMKANNRLSNEQISAIQSLISSAVQDLKSDHVAVVDSNGNLLARGSGDASGEASPVRAEEMRRSYESRMTAAIEDMVGRTVGFGNVRATVSAELNFDRISTNEEIFDPNQQVVRSSQTTNENSTERSPAGGGEVGANGNIPGNTAEALVQTAPSAQNNKTEETTNYEIGKTIRSTVREVGEAKRIAVSVLVNGITKTDAEGKKTYEPRPDAELKQIEKLVKSAIGFDEKRGDQVNVINMQFAEEEIPPLEDKTKILGFDKSDLLDAAQVMVVAIMIMLVVFLILQPMLGRLIASTASALEGEGSALLPARGGNAALMAPQMVALPNMSGGMPMPAETPALTDQTEQPESSMINVKSVEGKVKASAVKKVEDIVAAYPTETVSVLRSWMAQE